MKGLPLAYNRDLQEDKAPLFAARRDVATTTAAVDVLVRELTFDGDRLALAAADPLLLATDAAERLVERACPSAKPTSAWQRTCSMDGTSLPMNCGRVRLPGRQPSTRRSAPREHGWRPSAASPSALVWKNRSVSLHGIRERLNPLLCRRRGDAVVADDEYVTGAMSA